MSFIIENWKQGKKIKKIYHLISMHGELSLLKLNIQICCLYLIFILEIER